MFFKDLTEAKEMCDYFVQYSAGAHLVVSWMGYPRRGMWCMVSIPQIVS